MPKVRGRNLNVVLEMRKARRLSRLRAVLFGVVVLSVIAWIIATHERRQFVRAIDERRVVILPLENRTGDPLLDPLGAVASDWATQLLTFFDQHVDVVPTTTTLDYYRSSNLVVHDLQERAELLAMGVRAQRVAWGTFYQRSDSLRFDVNVSDILGDAPARSVARVAVPLANARHGVDVVAKRIVRAILDVTQLGRVESLTPPGVDAYSAFVTGLDHFAQRNYRSAAADFSAAVQHEDARRFQIWLADALVRDRQYARADSVIASVKGVRLPLNEADRAYTINGRINGDWRTVHAGADALAAHAPADDLAALDFALAALAINRPRQARTIMLRQDPNRGALRSRPDFYLHLAAAHHLSSEHDRERRVARRALYMHPTSVEVKLALCRAEAARGDAADAVVAVDRLASAGVAPALRDCAAELHYHELPDVAQRAESAASFWERRRPTPTPPLRDPFYERGYVAFDSARVAAERGDVRRALEQLWFALDSGLPNYEPGRMMLHAEPAFRRLRNTRGFLRAIQPRG